MLEDNIQANPDAFDNKFRNLQSFTDEYREEQEKLLLSEKDDDDLFKVMQNHYNSI